MKRDAGRVAIATFIVGVVACSSSSSGSSSSGSGASAAGCDPAKVYGHASAVDGSPPKRCAFDSHQAVQCSSTQTVGFSVTLSCNGVIQYSMSCSELGEAVQRTCTCTTPSGATTTTKGPQGCISCPATAAGATAIAIAECGFPSDTATNPTVDPP